MSNQQLPEPRVNYPAARYQEMAADFILNGQLSVNEVPELIKWRRYLRDLRHIVTGSKTEQGTARTLPNPVLGICGNLRLIRGDSCWISSVDLISHIARVWPVYKKLYAEAYVWSHLYPIPEFPEIGMWEGKALRYRLSLISFSIKLLTAAINQLKDKPA